MLVLTRKEGEEIVIGGSITVKVLEVTKSRVKLGFIAPGASIHRAEVYVKIEHCSPQDSYAEATLV